MPYFTGLRLEKQHGRIPECRWTERRRRGGERLVLSHVGLCASGTQAHNNRSPLDPPAQNSKTTAATAPPMRTDNCRSIALPGQTSPAPSPLAVWPFSYLKPPSVSRAADRRRRSLHPEPSSVRRLHRSHTVNTRD